MANARSEHGDRRNKERSDDFREQLTDKTVEELQDQAKELGIKDRSSMHKDELIKAISEHHDKK